MKGRKMQKIWILAVLAVALVLIIAGSVMVARVVSDHQRLILAVQDQQLANLVDSMDSNIRNIIYRCRTGMRFVISRQGFRQAEGTWLETGSTQDLLYRLEESLTYQDSIITAILALDGDSVVLSTDGCTDYEFISGGGSGDLRPCLGPGGAACLAFCSPGNAEGVSYAALIDLNAFYRQVVGNKLAETEWVLLLDSQGQILLHYQQNQVLADQVDMVSGATCGQTGVEILTDCQMREHPCTTSYEYTDNLTGQTYTARMIAVPSGQSANQCFAVGVVTNFDNVMDPLQAAGVRLMLYGFLVLAGVFLLIGMVLLVSLRNERSARELKLLKEKNAAMEELTRQTQELAHHQRLETIGTLTSSIAHEFNNLLTPIMGYSIMTLEQLPPESEELQDNILEIYNASRKAKEIISRLSDLSRKNNSLTNQSIDPNELVCQVLEVALPAKPLGVEIRRELGAQGFRILGNKTTLSQLVLNLVLNGFQAMEDGGILTVSTSGAAGKILLQVRDTGPGIPPEALPHIFEPFFTTKESGKGTGLGLAIAAQVAEEHGAEITVDSTASGCVFSVLFPAETGNPPDEG